MAIKQAKRPPPKNPTATDAPPPIGDNKPPAPDSIEAFRERYAEIKTVAGEWLALKEVTSQEEADNLEAFRKQVRGFKRDSETTRKNHEQAPKKVLAELKERWEPVATSADRILTALEPMIRAWLLKEEKRIAAAREAAEQKAREAAEEAERVARKAERVPHSIDAMDAVAEAAAAAERAEREAKAAAAEKAGAGGHVSVGGIKRSAGIRRDKKPRVVDVKAAVLFLIEQTGGELFFAEAAEKAARARFKGFPDDPIPGVVIEEVEKAV